MVKDKKNQGAEEKILSAARKIFTTKGMAGARMQDIANEAGINKALLHYYYRDKEKLFETIFLAEAQKFFPKINAIFQSDDPLFLKIEKFVDEYIDEMLGKSILAMVCTELRSIATLTNLCIRSGAKTISLSPPGFLTRSKKK
jgi:AcrR family transcriptional regulator